MLHTLDDLVPHDHPVRLIDLVVDQMVTANPTVFASERGDSEPGRPGFAPATMLKLFVYGYLINCRASRKLETETKRNIELIWLLGTLSPDHWVIAQYRRVHGDHIKTATKLFRQFLHAQGYIKGERVALDGTKLKANARREMLTVATIEQRLTHLDHQLDEYLRIFTANDLRDDVEDELETLDTPASVDRHLVEKIIALQQQIETLTTHKDTVTQSERPYLSPADPDAALMKTRDGKMPGYNVQSVVDAEQHMIVVTQVLTDQDDHAALPLMVQAVREELGITPALLTADAGYYTPDLIQQVETDTHTTCYIPPPQREDNPITFSYNASTDSYTCSAGQPLVLFQKNKRKRNSRADVYRGTQCGACHFRSQCTTSAKGRIVHRYQNQPWREHYGERMRTKVSKAFSALRKTLVEHPFGTIKLMGGKLPLLLRGRAKVTTEVNLYATVYNFKRLLNCTAWETIHEQVLTHSWKLA
jgi:transposase